MSVFFGGDLRPPFFNDQNEPMNPYLTIGISEIGIRLRFWENFIYELKNVCVNGYDTNFKNPT